MCSLAAQQAAFPLKMFSMRTVCSLLVISLLWLGCSKVLHCAGKFCLGKGWNKSGFFVVILCSLHHNLAGTLQTTLTSRPPDPGDMVGMQLLSPLKQRLDVTKPLISANGYTFYPCSPEMVDLAALPRVQGAGAADTTI